MNERMNEQMNETNISICKQTIHIIANYVPVTTTKGCNATAGEGGVLSIIRLVGDEGGIKGGDTPLKCTPFS